jgi:superoxide dismutase
VDDNKRNSDNIRSHYGSEDALRYDLIRAGMDIRYGFLCIYFRDGKLYYDASGDYIRLVVPNIPLLAVDVCEHAYFLDYGFDKERYLNRAVSYLNLSVIGKNEKDS